MSYYKVDGADLTAIANKIRSKGGTSAQLEFPDGFEDAVDDIKAYSASDNGKVVSNGELVAQTSQNIDTNGTYDTTLKDEVVVNIPSGAVKVASGTFVGAGSSTIALYVGKKCPQTDFILNIWVDNGTQITPNSGTDRISVINQIMVQKRFSNVDLSTDGNRTMSNLMTYPTYNSSGDSYTDRTPPTSVSNVSYVRMTTVVAEGNYFSNIKRDSNGFTFNFGKNAQYYYQNGITCNWELLYIGSDPTNDIVEVA